MNKILLHSCCGPCSLSIIDKFKHDNKELVSFFYNPNIQPYTEHKARKEAWLFLMNQTATPHLLNDSYPLEQWIHMVSSDIPNRCLYCYEVRLRESAKIALENNCDAFTTSLLISPYQKHEEIKKLGEQIGQELGIEFYYEDFRPLFREGQLLAREAGLYMQKYCGCIFSEKERYVKYEK